MKNTDKKPPRYASQKLKCVLLLEKAKLDFSGHNELSISFYITLLVATVR